MHALLELFDEAAGAAAEPGAAAAVDTGDTQDVQAALQQPPRKRQRTGVSMCIFVICSRCMASAFAVKGGLSQSRRCGSSVFAAET